MKTILITGASRGIGRACALRFAAPEHTLVLLCKANIAALTETANEASAYGARCFTYQTDISDSSEVNKLFADLSQRGLIIDTLINNAGISYTGLLQDMTDTDWHSVIETNLSSVFYCCRGVIPMMLKLGHGRIINISSMWGSKGASCEVAYSAAKGGVNAFTQALAKELAPSNIQVNAVSCGLIDTEMNSRLSADEMKEFAECYIASNRPGTAEETAEFIYSLARSGSYLTGQVIGFDGGIF